MDRNGVQVGLAVRGHSCERPAKASSSPQVPLEMRPPRDARGVGFPWRITRGSPGVPVGPARRRHSFQGASAFDPAYRERMQTEDHRRDLLYPPIRAGSGAHEEPRSSARLRRRTSRPRHAFPAPSHLSPLTRPLGAGDRLPGPPPRGQRALPGPRCTRVGPSPRRPTGRVQATQGRVPSPGASFRSRPRDLPRSGSTRRPVRRRPALGAPRSISLPEWPPTPSPAAANLAAVWSPS
jgi:hypothetical protein